MKNPTDRRGGNGRAEPSRRSFIRGALALLAGACLPRAAAADTVVYDEYGNPIVVESTTVVTTGYPTPYVPATPVYGVAGVRGQSRRVSRRTSRRTSRRN